ncbi:hypothetical protein FRX31_014679, partial [Thalictrum thalictroides]
MMDISNSVYLEQNLTKLLEKKVVLVDLKHQVERRSEPYRKDMDGWLRNLEVFERTLEEIQSTYNEINIPGFRFSKGND